MLAIPIGAVVLGLGWLGGLGFRHNLFTRIALGSIGFIIGLGVMGCAWIAVVGHTRSD